MKFPGGMNMQQMMKQAQQMQEKMQKEMEEMVVDATAGGGVVTVQMRGTKEVESIKIDPEAVKEGDVEMLQDLIVAAVARRQVHDGLRARVEPEALAPEAGPFADGEPEHSDVEVPDSLHHLARRGDVEVVQPSDAHLVIPPRGL